MNRKTSWFERAENVVNRVNIAFPNPEFENWGLCTLQGTAKKFICDVSAHKY